MPISCTCPVCLAKVYGSTYGHLYCTGNTTYGCMVTTASEDTAEVESKVYSVAETDVVQETKTHCKLLVHEVLSIIATVVCHEETSVAIRNHVPKASLLVSTDRM